ncbi:MAG: hypothetical protein ABI904_16080 [Chloroflexota bacterium]
MELNLGVKSIICFVFSVLLLVLITLFDALLSGLSTVTERVISLLLLVLPGIVGVAYGILSIIRKELRTWVAILGIFLNALFALFHLFVISFAG